MVPSTARTGLVAGYARIACRALDWGGEGGPAERLARVIKARGLVVVEDVDESDAWLDYSRGIIRVSPSLDEYTRLRSVARELAHFQMHRVLLEAGTELDQRHRRQAEAYALELLDPSVESGCPDKGGLLEAWCEMDVGRLLSPHQWTSQDLWDRPELLNVLAKELRLEVVEVDQVADGAAVDLAAATIQVSRELVGLSRSFAIAREYAYARMHLMAPGKMEPLSPETVQEATVYAAVLLGLDPRFIEGEWACWTREETE